MRIDNLDYLSQRGIKMSASESGASPAVHVDVDQFLLTHAPKEPYWPSKEWHWMIGKSGTCHSCGQKGIIVSVCQFHGLPTCTFCDVHFSGCLEGAKYWNIKNEE